ncbi:hypothetical protein KY290_022272 [Solanum tuberosum]|uniref:Uncharacterized protein n=1 Tax=Solanum tuberosum TaxID=4113 RepID=A0ABQ7V3V4_SOLTU|nr:hypothetical protein KY289_021401 [Solanum tuberosum]KAH0758779.1 hypothetical protein KY290_022272 [Solanum tuberosum]
MLTDSVQQQLLPPLSSSTVPAPFPAKKRPCSCGIAPRSSLRTMGINLAVHPPFLFRNGVEISEKTEVCLCSARPVPVGCPTKGNFMPPYVHSSSYLV